MAELGTVEAKTTSCCYPAAQETCCEPEAKSECCRESHGGGCGCSADDVFGWTLARHPSAARPPADLDLPRHSATVKT